MASGDKAVTERQTAELESLANQIQTSIESNQCSPYDWTQKLRNLRNTSAGSYKQGETVKDKYTEILVALRECVVRELERDDAGGRFHEDLITALNLLRDASQNDQ